MRKIIALFLSMTLILVACHDEQAAIYSENKNVVDDESEELLESQPESTADGLSGTLEISYIYVAEDYIGWWALAEGFMELHPDVKIISNDNAVDWQLYDIDTETEAKIAEKKYIDELNIQIISGNAPDLIFDVSTTSVPTHLLMDLNEFIDNDPEYVREDYFDTVVRAHEVDGELKEYPLTLKYYFLRFRQDVMDELGIDVSELEIVDYNFLFDTLSKINESGKFPEIKYLGYEGQEGQRVLYEYAMTDCIDSQTLEMNFEDPQFINYLNTTKAYVPGPLPEFGHYTNALEPSEEMELFESESHFVEDMDSSNYNLSRTVSNTDTATQAVPITTSDGEIVLSTDSVAIPTNAKNPELAWEFIKYCIEESEVINTYWEYNGRHNGDRFFYDIPINKNNFKLYYEDSFASFPKESADNFFESVFENLEGSIRTRGMNSELSEALYHIQTDFYNDMMTAEECAKAMQDRAEIYFAEIE